MEISWGIIGCGDVTEVKSGPAFNKVPFSRLQAVMRRNASKAEDYAKRHQVPRWYANAGELISDPQINAVYVATPPLQHEVYAIDSLKAGKPVYLEKPMAIDSAAAKRILAMQKETGVLLSIAHYRRQQPLFLHVKSLLEQGAIGSVKEVHLQFFQPHKTPLVAQTDVNWRLNPSVSGGGLFHDLAPHQLDLMVYFFGAPVQYSGQSSNQGGLYEADDTVQGKIIFDKGVVFEGSWCFVANERTDKCVVTGSEGKISFSVFEQEPVVLETRSTLVTTAFDRLQHVQQPMIEQVVRYFRGEALNPCSAEEGVLVMELIDSFTQ